MNETLAITKIIEDHYQNQKIKSTILKLSSDGNFFRAGNGDFSKWYMNDSPEQGKCRLFDLSGEKDYNWLTERHRTLYWTLNFFGKDVKNQFISISLKDEKEKKITIGGYDTTRAYSLGVDIDKVEDIHKNKEAVEEATKFFLDYLSNIGVKKSVHIAFSGGGVYIYIHHKLFEKIFTTPQETEFHYYLLVNAYNCFIKEVEEKFFEKYPQYKDQVKFDAINNAKRVFKTLFSVHRKYDYAVIPLDKTNIKINFNDAKIPLSDEIIKRGEMWYGECEEEEKKVLIEHLKKYEDKIIEKYEGKCTTSDIKISEIPLEEETFPPCIRKIIKINSVPVGKTRAITLLCTFLGQCGWEEDKAKKLFEIVADRIGASTSNIFQSWFKKMNCPLCKTIQEKGSGFPSLTMGEIGVCESDLLCREIKSPIEYVNKKQLEKITETEELKSMLPLIIVKEGKQRAIYQTAKVLTQNHHFFTLKDTEEVLYYDHERGVYKFGGEKIIKENVEDIWSNLATMRDVNEVIGHIQRMTYIYREEFDRMNINKICIKNGILNLETEELGGFSPENKYIVSVPVIYDPNAKCPKIKKFLSEILNNNDIPTVFELIGYCLYRKYNFHKAFMFVGDGANGKSTLINLIQYFLGDKNCCSISLQDLEQNRFSKGRLYGKLANLYADLPYKALQTTGMFKMLTGEDEITTDQKWKDFLSFKNCAKLIFSTNRLPAVHDDSSAFFRRWIILTFPNVFDEKRRNVKILEEITTEEEMSGLLNEALEGLKRVFNQGDFSTRKTTEEWMDEYTRGSNSVKAFVKDCIEISFDSIISKWELYNIYLEYCKFYNIIIKSKNSFFRTFPQYVKVDDTKISTKEGRKQAFKGIRLKRIEDFDEKTSNNGLDVLSPLYFISIYTHTFKEREIEDIESSISQKNSNYSSFKSFEDKKNRTLFIYHIVENQSKKSKDMLAMYDDIIIESEKNNITEEDTKEILDILKKDGKIVEIKPNQFMVV